MNRKQHLKQVGLMLSMGLLMRHAKAVQFLESFAGETILDGPFEPTWKSLQKYQTPEWYRNAKFGRWAHWGLQCPPKERPHRRLGKSGQYAGVDATKYECK